MPTWVLFSKLFQKCILFLVLLYSWNSNYSNIFYEICSKLLSLITGNIRIFSSPFIFILLKSLFKYLFNLFINYIVVIFFPFPECLQNFLYLLIQKTCLFMFFEGKKGTKINKLQKDGKHNHINFRRRRRRWRKKRSGRRKGTQSNKAYQNKTKKQHIKTKKTKTKMQSHFS